MELYDVVKTKVDAATQWKTTGNESFKTKKYRLAEAQYQEGLRFLETPTNARYSEEELNIVAPIQAALHVNIASCILQNDIHLRQAICMDHCTMAIEADPKYVKAWYRRSQAYMQLKDYVNAKHDIQEAIRLDPTNASIRKYAERIHQAWEEMKRQEKNTFKGLFK